MGTHLKKTLNFFSCSSPRLSSVFSLHASFSRFEDDVWIAISKYLDGRSLVMLATTCKWFYKTLSAECVWKYASLRDLAVPDPGDVSFSWKKLYESAFDGSHSCLFHQQEKHIDACCMVDRRMVFVRDFVPSALACLMKDPPDTEIVKNFLLKTLHLQGREKRIDNFTLGGGVMPASFKVEIDEKNERVKEILEADYGGTAIGRVAPMDSGFWWIILLRSYVKSTSDRSLTDQPDVQKGMKLILDLCLSDGFDTFPSLLCADACCMIDRRMEIYGYPIEIQSLFFFALRCAKNMLKEVPADNKELLDKINSKIKALSYHIRTYYWFDDTQLNNIYLYKTEEYSHTALNKFNLSPESIPDWLFEFMPLRGGYFIGNFSPACMDFRWFLLGNCIAILSSLATPKQASAILDLIEACWDELVGETPLKISYPALEGYDRNIITGFDSKNTRWSYHNGGSWPVLLWLCIKTARPQMAGNAIELVEKHLSNDGWPEYYDGKTGRYIGKQARILQFENDEWIEIDKYLDERSLVMLATTCKWFYKTLSEECMWKYACLCDLAVPDQGDVSFNWKNLYISAFDGSHSYLFCQQEKHIDWIQIGAFFLESSATIVTEKLTSPPRKIHLKDTLKQMLQSCGLCVLANIKFHVMSSSLETVETTIYRGDRDEGNGDDDGDDSGGGNDGGGDGGEEGQGESPDQEEEGDEGNKVIGGPEEKKGEVVGVYLRLREEDEDITLITNLDYYYCRYRLLDLESLFDHVRDKVAEANHPAVPRYYDIVLEKRTNTSKEFSEMFTEYEDISNHLKRVIIRPDRKACTPLVFDDVIN